MIKIENNQNALEVFLDQNRENVEQIILNIDVLAKQIHENSISKTIIIDIAKELSEVAKIFGGHESLMSIAPIVIALEKFLEIINLSFSPENPHAAIGYLGNILDDLNENISDIFVTRVYSDVYVFEDSLVSNITYMTNALLGKQNVEQAQEAQLELF